jgi:hypothetical protein
MVATVAFVASAGLVTGALWATGLAGGAVLPAGLGAVAFATAATAATSATTTASAAAAFAALAVGTVAVGIGTF